MKLKGLVSMPSAGRGRPRLVQLLGRLERVPTNAQRAPCSRLRARQREGSAAQRDMGVQGVKIDFFGGDGASMQAYYLAPLRDTPAAGLMVNFLAPRCRAAGPHLPQLQRRPRPSRGFGSSPGQPIRGQGGRHAAMLLHAQPLRPHGLPRPWCLATSRNIQRRTRTASRPRAGRALPLRHPTLRRDPRRHGHRAGRGQNLLRQLPRRWDETRFIDGGPGRFASSPAAPARAGGWRASMPTTRRARWCSTPSSAPARRPAFH